LVATSAGGTHGGGACRRHEAGRGGDRDATDSQVAHVGTPLGGGGDAPRRVSDERVGRLDARRADDHGWVFGLGLILPGLLPEPCWLSGPATRSSPIPLRVSSGLSPDSPTPYGDEGSGRQSMGWIPHHVTRFSPHADLRPRSHVQGLDSGDPVRRLRRLPQPRLATHLHRRLPRALAPLLGLAVLRHERAQ
jgi:hypothetical protein